MEEIRWGMIGCGKVTEKKSAPAFKNIPGADLVAVMSRNPENARDYAMHHGVPQWYDDADKLIHDPKVNAIYIATPPVAHMQYTLSAAEAGKPVYVEKPMALTYGECERMNIACHDAGIPLFVAYYRRSLPLFLKIKELVDSDVIGEVRFVKMELYRSPQKQDFQLDDLPWRVVPEISGGGYFFDLGCHQLDYLDYLLGPIISVKGEVANQMGLYPAEDIVCASFTFQSGVLGSGIWCFTATEQHHLDRSEIIGDKGKIIYSAFEQAPVCLETPEGRELFHFPTPQHIQQPLIQTIIDELQGKGQCPSNGISAARTSRVMDEILSDWQFKL